MITLGADKAYNTKDFIHDLRSMKVTPHVAQNTKGRRSAIDGRTTRHPGYRVSLRIRKRIEEAFGVSPHAFLPTCYVRCGRACPAHVESAGVEHRNRGPQRYL